MADGSQLFLGLPDERIKEDDDNLCTWSTNKFGGRPNWMTCLVDEYPACKLCRRILLLVSQIYCPLTDSLYHRTLYIFGCVNPFCWNQPESWTVLRSQVIEESNVTEDDKDPVKCNSVDDWGDDAEDWGDADDWNDSLVTELENAASKLSLNPVDPVEDTNQIPVIHDNTPKPLTSSMNQDTPCFQPLYINVFESTKSNKETSKTSLTSHEKELLLRYQEQEGVSIDDVLSLPNQSNIKQQDHVAEDYEKTTVAHGDKGFHRFQKCLQQCPQQCIRYEWNGTPLSMSSSFGPSDIMSTVTRCQYCGSQRVYELQLMPALVVLLKIKESSLHSTLPAASGIEQARTSIQNKCIVDKETVNVKKTLNEELGTLSEDVSKECRGIEFGTVIVFSCSKSCWDDTDELCLLREESVVVQADPDTELFKNKF